MSLYLKRYIRGGPVNSELFDLLVPLDGGSILSSPASAG